MFRYRCPRCFHLLQAPEIRAGKTTVCSKCSQPLTIPADKSQWLNEKGEPLLTSPTVVIPTGMTPPPLRPGAEGPASDADNDVLGAIYLGAVSPPFAAPPPRMEPVPAPTGEPQALPHPAFSRSLPEPAEDDGKVGPYPPTPKTETPPPPEPEPVPPPPPRPGSRHPVPAATPVPTRAGLTSRSGSRAQRSVAVAPPPARPARGTAAVAVQEPLRLRTGMDIAVDLTAALTTRMKPPPRPPRDLRPATAVCILVMGIALALVAATLFTGAPQPGTMTAPAPDITTQSKAAQLRHYRDQRQYDALIGLLQTLKQPDSLNSVEATNRIDLAAVLKELCKHPAAGVKVEALAAYAVWGGDDARGLCLEASSSPNREERLTALRLLPRWKDPLVARRIAERIGRPGTETTAAENALIDLGGPVAEEAAIALLWNEDQGIRLTAIDILGNERVGGLAAVAALQDVARRSSDPGTSTAAARKAQQIQSRLKK